MKKILIISSLLLINFSCCYGFSKSMEMSYSQITSGVAFDTTRVELDGRGDTIALYVYSDSKLIEKRSYYRGNRLRMVRKYSEGKLIYIDKSLNVKGNPIYPGTYTLGTGSIIKYNIKGDIESVELWSNYELIFIEYFLKRRVKRVIYAKNLPIYSVITKMNGIIESKTTYGQDGTTIITTEYFDEKLNVVMTLYGH